MSKCKTVLGFKGEYWFPSSFYPSPIVIDGIEYPTVEHYFQSMRATDPGISESIRSIETPKQARRLERRIKLEKSLIETGDLLLLNEVNNWGKSYWGCVRDKEKKLARENHYGQTPMEVRKYPQDVFPKRGSFQELIERYIGTINFRCEDLS